MRMRALMCVTAALVMGWATGCGDEGSSPSPGGTTDAGSDAVGAGECAADAECPAPADACQLARCVDGACVVVKAPDGGGCDDDDPCTLDDGCQNGACVGAPKTCDDEEPCTEDQCEPVTGLCEHTTRTTGECDDGDPCTEGDTCATGACAGTDLVCDDGDQCTVDACVAAEGGCVFDESAAEGADCDDGDLCTTSDECAGGACSGDTKNCADGDPCTDDGCDASTGECTYTPGGEGSPCEDGDPCTTGDACTGGTCEGGVKDCDDGNPCTVDSCDLEDGSCLHDAAAVDGEGCDDGLSCTEGDACAAGICAGTNSCDDDDPCTDDLCDPDSDACAFPAAADGGACDDGEACTAGDACLAGACVGSAIICEDDSQCTADSCDPATGECVFDGAALEGAECDDGEICTQLDACAGGTCVGTPLICDDGEDCTEDSCEAGVGCVFDAGALEGAGCDDGDLCTDSSSCLAGSCVGVVKDCDDGVDCTQDGCDPGSGECVSDAGALDGAACVDGACDGTCLSGLCEVVGGSCDDGSACTVDSCDPATGACGNDSSGLEGAPCDDGDLCTEDDTCIGGSCLSVPVICDDGEPCTEDSCDPATGCVFDEAAAEGSDCEDGLACTLGSTCVAGTCGVPTSCGPGFTCEEPSGDCVENEGDVCEGAMGIGALPFTISGTTLGFIDDYAYAAGQCEGEVGGAGAGAPDVVYAFAAPVAASYRVTLNADFDATLYVMSDCGDADSCIKGEDLVGVGPESVDLPLASGQQVYLVVDGSATGAAGNYQLTVGLPCFPSCGGKACGPDGCGGSCGPCADDTTCLGGQCQASLSFCNPGFPVSCGTSLSNLSNSVNATFAFAGYGCAPGDFSATPEVAYIFNPAQDAKVEVRGLGAGELSVQVLEGQATGGCQGGVCIASGKQEAEFEAVAGTTYYLVWDAAGPTAEIDYSFGMEVDCCVPSCEGVVCGDDGCGGSCGACPAGSFCQDGVCGALPTTCSVAGVFGCGALVEDLRLASVGAATAWESYSCYDPGVAGLAESPELVYALTVEQDLRVTVETLPGPGFAGELYSFALPGAGGCEGANLSCVDGGPATTPRSFDAQAGETWYLSWDAAPLSAPELAEATFDVAISCCEVQCEDKECGTDGCGGSCGTCDGGFCSAGQCVDAPDVCTPVASLACGEASTGHALTDAGVSAAFATLSCGADSDSPELTWSHTAGGADELVTFTTAPELTVTALLDTGAGCEDTGANCLASGLGSVTASIAAGETLHFVVEGPDGIEAAEIPAFDASVDCCIPDCEGKNCGADGCGGTCGQCAAGDICEPFQGLCIDAATAPGNTCSKPFAIPQLPVSVDGDTTFASNAAAAPPGACGALPLGADARDHVYEVFLEAASYDLTLTTTDFDGVLFIASTCEAEGCIASVDVGGAGATETLEFDVEVAGTYVIVVDGFTANAYGSYTLTLSEPCVKTCGALQCQVDDGCGGLCECAGGLSCNAGTQTCVAPQQGENCSDPLPLELGVTYTGDTNEWLNDYDQTDACGAGAAGDQEPDVVYAFTPASSGSYAITMPGYVKGEWASLVWVSSDCAGGSCLAEKDFYNDTDPLVVTLSEGVTYYFIIDSYVTAEIGPYALLVTPN